MRAAELQRARRARPFRPFTLHLADGRELPVTHPELILVATEARAAVVYIPRQGIEIIDLPLVTGLSFRGKRRSG